MEHINSSSLFQNFNVLDNNKYIHFHNNTNLPIMLSSWIDNSNSKLSIKIDAYEKKLIHSSVGEWHLDSMFPNREDSNNWINYFGKDSFGYQKYTIVGKFRSTPDYSKNYSYMEYEEHFQCVYSVIDNGNDTHEIKGLITYSIIDNSTIFIK